MPTPRSRRHGLPRPRTHARRRRDARGSPLPHVLFVTNNASRGPAEVAQHLCAMGFTAKPDDIVTSAQSAARLLQEQLQPGAPVLIVGTDSLAAEVRNVGLKPVRQWSDDPVAVVQGHSPQTGWPDLAEAALAIRGGALWVAANVDRTLPSERGLLPGNGAMVAALRAATDSEPQVAGKPEPTSVDGRVGARQVSHSTRRRRPSRHRHRGRQRRRPAQPARALRRQHRRRNRARRRRTTAQLHRRRSALAVRPRRQPSHRAAPGVARRRRPVGRDRAVDRPGPGRPVVGGPCDRQRSVERPASTGGASS